MGHLVATGNVMIDIYVLYADEVEWIDDLCDDDNNNTTTTSSSSSSNNKKWKQFFPVSSSSFFVWAAVAVVAHYFLFRYKVHTNRNTLQNIIDE